MQKAKESRIRQQSLVWVNFPFSNLQETKIRPAVVVSNNNYNQAKNDVILCAVTSNLSEKEYGITLEQSDLSDGKLPVRSMIRSDKIMQVEKTIILGAFAKVSDKTFDKLTPKITALVKRD